MKAFPFPSHFSSRTRTVELDGEAYFDVRKNPEKQFIVSTAHQSAIKVLGTKFNVQLTQEEAKTMFVDFIPELPPDDGTAVVNFYIDSDEDDGTLVKKAEQEIKDLRMFVDIGEGTITRSETEDKK